MSARPGLTHIDTAARDAVDADLADTLPAPMDHPRFPLLWVDGHTVAS